DRRECSLFLLSWRSLVSLNVACVRADAVTVHRCVGPFGAADVAGRQEILRLRLPFVVDLRRQALVAVPPIGAIPNDAFTARYADAHRPSSRSARCRRRQVLKRHRAFSMRSRVWNTSAKPAHM